MYGRHSVDKLPCLHKRRITATDFAASVAVAFAEGVAHWPGHLNLLIRENCSRNWMHSAGIPLTLSCDTVWDYLHSMWTRTVAVAKRPDGVPLPLLWSPQKPHATRTHCQNWATGIDPLQVQRRTLDERGRERSIGID